MLKLAPELSSRLELALWSPAATTNEFEALFTGAVNMNARAICVPSSRVNLACARLEDTSVKIIGLAGFPLGNNESDVKRFEAETAIDFGAQEIEVVLNHADIKDGEVQRVLRELRDLVETADERPVYLAAELSWLSSEQLVQVCHIALDAGIAGLSIGTGFWGHAPDSEQVKRVREATSAKFIIKAAAVADQTAADTLILAGADRLGVIVTP